ncbi:MAG: hypothetical protein WCS77_06420 [Elusimicrobiaceae bacterium]
MKTLFAVLAYVTFCCSANAADILAPKGWRMSAGKPAAYALGIETTTIDGQQHRVLLLKSTSAQYGEYTAVTQEIKASEYLAARVEFSAYIKSENVANNTGLWLRAYNGNRVMALSNIAYKPITGTTSWHKYTLVLDIPEGSTEILFGWYLTGTGKVWVREASFSKVKKHFWQRHNQLTPSSYVLPITFENENGDFVINDNINHVKSDQFSLSINTATLNNQERKVINFRSTAMLYEPAELIKTIPAEKYSSSRTELSVYAKTEKVAGVAVLFISGCGVYNYQTLANTLAQTPSEVATGWTKYSVLMDLQDNCNTLTFGVTFSGFGDLWLGNWSLRASDKIQPLTMASDTNTYQKHPINLNFTE